MKKFCMLNVEAYEYGMYIVDKNGHTVFSMPTIKSFLCRRDIVLCKDKRTGKRSLWIWNPKMSDYYEISLRGFCHFLHDWKDYLVYVMA